MNGLALLAALSIVRPATSPIVAGSISQSPHRWQQRIVYRIEGRLDEGRQVLEGRLRLDYTNRSPDTLDRIYLHLYLNAFRPDSRWARTERRPRFDFQHLEEPDYGFERLGRVAVDGAPVEAVYPYAPDSTVVELRLPRPLAPGARLVLTADWTARPSTIARRQGRRGRHWDFAQWYPRIAVYDRFGWEAHPLYPQGEFYGEFGTYDVALEVPADQVIGATGVPVEGDPGWAGARAPGTTVTYLRDYYGTAAPGVGPGRGTGGRTGATGSGRAPAGRAAGTGGGGEGLGLLGDRPPPGYKRVRWRAERVHHFAWSADPRFRYEEGRSEGIVLRSLYLPEEMEAWSGTAIRNMGKALAWLDTIFGPYPWPQLTALHRIEGGGTEFPMLVMLGGASESLIVHEVGHEYTFGVLADNEWKEGWLDEGFTTFQTRWYMTRRYGPYGSDPAPRGLRALAPRATRRESTEMRVLALDLADRSQPVSTVSEDFSEFSIYNRMIYSKGSLVLDMLRYVIGDETFRRFLRTFYDRWKLRHIDEDAFRSTAEEACRCDLNWFLGEWLHATPLIDYALGDVDVRPSADSGYVTTVEVVRKEDGVMPVEVAVRGRDGEESRVRVPGRAPRERARIVTRFEPREVVVDPDGRILDWNPTNNRRGSPVPLLGQQPATNLPEIPFLEPKRRDGLVREWLPMLWYNDADHVILGFRTRTNLMGDVAREELGAATDLDFDAAGSPYDWARLRNPTWWRLPRWTNALDLWYLEGRTGAALRMERHLSTHLNYAPERRVWLGLHVMDADAAGGRLRPGRWTPGTTAELRLGYRERRDAASGRWTLRAESASGAYRFDGRPPGRKPSGGYVRGTADLRWTAGDSAGPFVAGRLFGGGIAGPQGLPDQRRVFVAGAGPYEAFWNPLLRSRGALLRRGDVRYFEPGDAGLRAYRPELSGLWAATGAARGGARVEPASGTLVEVSAFVEGGWMDGERVLGPAGPTALGLVDAGPGFRIQQKVLDSALDLRVDFPVYSNRPDLAADARNDRWGFRWSFTVGAGF